MILYHTSDIQVTKPDTLHSRTALDFGKGFYLTSLRGQAEKYGEKFTDRGQPAWLNIYEMSEDWSAWRVKTFDHYDEEWLDYVTACRKDQPHEEYNMVVGGIADDKVFTTVNLYFLNMMAKDEALRRLAYEKPNNQYCISAAEMLRECITYKDSVKL